MPAGKIGKSGELLCQGEEKSAKSRHVQNQPIMNETENNQYLHLPSGEYETKLSVKYENKAPYRHVSPYCMEAFMPGTIRQICVEPGQRVQKGQKVLVLDAMKMDNELLSPVDGIVKSILVEEGKSIPKHQLLIEFLPIG